MTRVGVLVVEDDRVVRESLEQWLELSGFRVFVATNVPEGLATFDREGPDVVLSDVRMPGRSGIDLLCQVNERAPSVAVVLITAHGDVPMAVEAMRLGAFDFIQKPFVPEHLVKVLKRAADQVRLKREIGQLRRRLDGGEAELASRLVGTAPAMYMLRTAVKELAQVDADVIIRGETGTGKEVVSRCLHDLSGRKNGPFVAVNCAAIPAELIESELFGHEAGSFTGSKGRRVGKFEFASGGSLLLDEIESMPLAAQAKVLRVVQERVVERVGSNVAVPLDIRIFAASKADLRAESQAGRFRSDLYYRLNVASIDIPPLRERIDDVPLLFQMFLEQACARSGRPVAALTPADHEALMRHTWPGNVRELRAAAEQFALGLANRRTIAAILGNDAAGAPASLSLQDRLASFEKHLIESELARQNYSVAEVLKVLRIPRRTLNEKMSRLGIRRVRG